MQAGLLRELSREGQVFFVHNRVEERQRPMVEEPETREVAEQIQEAAEEGREEQHRQETRLRRRAGVIVGLLAGGSAKRTDLRLLCKPFAQLLRETPAKQTVDQESKEREDRD